MVVVLITQIHVSCGKSFVGIEATKMMIISSSRYADVGKLCHPSNAFNGIHLLGGIIANIPVPQFSKGHDDVTCLPDHY